MKNLFLSTLFFVVSFLSVTHSVEHLNHQHHDKTECLVCITGEKIVSADTEHKIVNTQFYSFFELEKDSSIFRSFTKKPTNQNRAPPVIIS